MTSECPYGFRIVGSIWETRRVVDATAAFSGYAACDERAEMHREAYLSAFQFGEDFRRLLLETGSTAGFSGPCSSPWVWFDIDRSDLSTALKDTRRLALNLDGQYCPGDNDLLIFFSGSKGFHIGLPTCLWTPAPSVVFHQVARRFAEHVAGLATVTIDAGVYDRVRAFRAPNSRHPKTGLHKRRFALDELTGLSLHRIIELSREPFPFEIPQPIGTSEAAAADWQAAVALVAQEVEARTARRAAGNGSPTLNRSTLDFIREGAATGDRHRLLYSAAVNLGEFGCTPALALALLEESALDSGLPQKDVRRGIECGLDAAGTALSVESTQHIASGTTETALDGSIVKEPPEAAASDSGALQGQTCQPLPAVPRTDLSAGLARLWQPSPTPKAAVADEAVAVLPLAIDSQGFDWATGEQTAPGELPPLPPPLPPLPSRAVGSGKLEKPCRCGSTDYAELPISDGRTRRDCRKCGRFVGWGRWYDQGGSAQ